MSRIIILDEGTSNKIAAGEVIERPASVVKELVENSIDAGASSVQVEIKNGGITFIKVSDNGSGMDEDDVAIAFERHATSKIRKASDLEAISTFGFRGEALASIAAVSNVELVTRTREKTYGTMISLSGGVINDVRQTGCPVGTTIIVKDLFFNTPARFKFLKKDSSEAASIAEIITKAALGNPAISFRLASGGAEVLHTPGDGDLKSAIFSIYGKDTAARLAKVSFIEGKYGISGFIGLPEISRSNRSCQSLFVNMRPVRSRLLANAVDEACQTLFMKNRYPVYVLNLELNPVLVDVNVHPSKLEIRFSDEREVFRCMHDAVGDALLRGMGSRAGGEDGNRTITPMASMTYASTVKDYENMKVDTLAQRVGEDDGKYSNLPNNRAPADDNTGGNAFALSDSQYIGQAFSTYIILQQRDSLLLIDQHAAHERIVYEKLKKKYDALEPLAQMIVSPAIAELTAQESVLLEEKAELMRKLGFEYQPFGKNSVLVRSIPGTDTAYDAGVLFKDALARLSDTDIEKEKAAADDILYDVACKAAIKANRSLGEHEIANLLSELDTLENPYTCPHGRPVAYRMTKYEMERIFKRIV